MRRMLITGIAAIVLIAFPTSAFAAPPASSGSEYEAAWADYNVEIEGLGTAYLGVGASSGSFHEGDYTDRWSEASFYLFAEGLDCFGYVETQFDLDRRLSGASVTAEIEGECFFYDPGEGHGDAEPVEEPGAVILHEGGEGGEPDSVAITALLDVTFVGTGVATHSNGFWRSPGFRCSSAGTDRDATATGVLEIAGFDGMDLVIDLSNPEDAGMSRYTDSCQATGSPGPVG